MSAPCPVRIAGLHKIRNWLIKKSIVCAFFHHFLPLKNRLKYLIHRVKSRSNYRYMGDIGT